MNLLSVRDEVLDRDLAVAIRDLHVTYRAFVHRKARLRSRLLRVEDSPPAQSIYALRGVTADVPRGSSLGVIGANGAGKSTLLRTIAGILPPSQGEVAIRGEVSTLLSLGVGFNKRLTGRENVYLGGLAAGLQRRDIDELFDEIVDFAGIGEFIEYPLRTYSSGMAGRLAFAVSVCIEPDILIVDEALSTGDAAFKKKSNQRMHELIERAGTLIVVSHGLATILDLTTNCLWLDKGRVMGEGDPKSVVAEYKRFLKVGDHLTAMEDV